MAMVSLVLTTSNKSVGNINQTGRLKYFLQRIYQYTYVGFKTYHNKREYLHYFLYMYMLVNLLLPPN